MLVTKAEPIIKALDGVRVVIIDCETRSIKPHIDHKILAGVAVQPLNGQGWYLPVRHVDVENNASFVELKKLIKALVGKTLVMHNARFDTAVLKQEGFDLSQEDLLDTIVMMRLVKEDEPNYRLKALAKKYLDPTAGNTERKITAYRAQLTKKGLPNTYDQIPTEVIHPYVMDDLRFTQGLYLLTLPLIEKRNLVKLLELEKELTKTLLCMEEYGFKIDRDHVVKQKEQLTLLSERLTKELFEIAGEEFAYTKPDDLDRVFAAVGIHSPKSTEKTQRQCWDKGVLRAIKHPLAQTLVKLKAVDKLNKNYYDNIIANTDSNDVLHGSFNQAGARTSRLSASNPNLQNLPTYEEEILGDELKGGTIGKVRGSFIPRPGKLLLSIDWKQVEMRVFADYAKEENFIKAFELGLDIHAITALSAIGTAPPKSDVTAYENWRRDGKNFGFGILYGLGITGLAIRLGRSKAEARKVNDRFATQAPKAKRFMNDVKRVCTERGYVRDRFDRRRYLTPEFAYQAINFLVQGTSATMIKTSLNRLHKSLVLYASQVVSTIHDENVIEIPYVEAEEVIPIIVRDMEDWDMFSVPIKCDLDWSPVRWSEKYSLNCERCNGNGTVADRPEDEIFNAFYNNDRRLLNSVKLLTCPRCEGKRFDLTKIKRT